MPRASAHSRDKVFIVYGRDRDARDALKRALEELGLEVLDWERAVAATGKGSPHVSEVLQAAMRTVKAVVVLMTGDSEARLLHRFCTQDELTTEGAMRPQARQNVIFEAGLAFAFFPKSTIIVKMGRLTIPSDLDGVQYVSFDFSLPSRQALSNRLRIAGCKVFFDPAQSGGTGPAPPDSGLPPVQTEGKPGVARIALFRRLRSLIPVPGLGGSLEITADAVIGEKLMISVKVESGAHFRVVNHWPPGSITPETVDLRRPGNGSDDEYLPFVIKGPAGIHYFDLLGNSADEAHATILARTSCAVSEP